MRMETKTLVWQILYCFMLNNATSTCKYDNNCHECYEDPSCNSGYMCDDGHCIPGGRRDTTVSLVFGVLIVVIVVFLCWCCIMLKDEAQGNRKITPRVVTPDAETSRMRHIQQNEQMGSNEVSSANELPQHEEARNQISDTIAYSCLQSYIDDRYNTEAPPPSYEEVMGASQGAVHSRPLPNQQHVAMIIRS